MKPYTRFLSLLLALVMVFTMLPTAARAEETIPEAVPETAPESIPETIPETAPEITPDAAPAADLENRILSAVIPFQVNPLYEGLYEPAPEDIPQLPEPGQVAPQGVTYQSEAEAAKTIRKNMKNRTETYTIYVYSTNRDYNALFAELLNMAVEHTGVGTEGDYLMWQLAGWGGEVSRTSSGGGYNYTYTYVTPYYTTAAEEARVTQEVNNLIAKLGIRYKSDYEKVCAVYDWLCDNVTYDYDNLEDESYSLKFTAYAALVNKTAVCQGYALLFYRLMLELGVDARFIGGDGGGGPHAWNIVQLGDYYYNLDATWDAGYADYEFFLQSTWNFLGHYRDPEFDTWEFHMDYPMAGEDYVHGGTATLDPIINMGVCGTEENDYLNAIWVMMRDGTLYIEGEGTTYDYKKDELPYWFYWIDHIEKAEIAESITRLGDYVFYEAPALKSFSLPESLTEIGDYAFAKSSLETVELSGGLETLGESVFESCKALKTATIAGSLTTVGNDVFRECTALEDVTFSDGPTLIGASMFNGCTALKSAVLPDSIRKISASAFSGCEALTELVLPEGLEFLGNYAFNGCTSLKSVTIPGTLTTIKQLVFADCTGLESVTFNEGLTSTGFGMFLGCTALTHIEFPDSLAEIQEAAFKDCTALTSVNLPENVKILGEDAFYGCSALVEIQIPDTVTEIGQYCFYYCEALKKANIPAGLTVINNGIFGHCALEELKLPAGITSIGEAAFVFNAFSKVVIPEGVTIINVGAFNDCHNLESVSLPSTLKTLFGFGGCSSLTDITLPEGLIEIGQFTFSNCDALEAITIPTTVIRIANGCWNECDNLKNIYFLGNAPAIGYNAFTGVTATAYYPAGNSSWTESVMKNYNGTITWKVACSEHVYESVVTAPTCEEQGYTTYTCTACGDSYVDDYTDPVDHVYEDGACKWCGEVEKVYSITWKQAYASLGGNIAVVFQADLSEDLAEDPNAFMRFTYAGKTVDIPVSEAARAGSYYNFFCRITSVNMTDDITAQMMVGEETVGKSVTTSLEKYCSYIISTSKDTKTVNLMKAMLNYGAAAQKMMNYKLDNLANKSLSDADKVLTKVDATQYKHSITGTEDGIKPVEALLVLGSETTIRVGFQLTGNKTIDQYTFTVDGVEVRPEYKGGKYVLEVPNIAAHLLDEYHTFTCGGITITYCGLSYVNQVMSYYTEGTTFDMAAALYNYSQATEAYIS